ncbi:hypothetical protein ZIOFF_050064 [Zingiber officinale]|uniref:Uncharacterized protein n=1 Tax=Zingiber officinale TaxID=94328 RepID=A0A8J5FKL9_ZINOF|nr:hypothetical protein ZIOFF_050064 [Zingiber officinale]
MRRRRTPDSPMVLLFRETYTLLRVNNRFFFSFHRCRGYLLEPLWWIGMVTSNPPFPSIALVFLFLCCLWKNCSFLKFYCIHLCSSCFCYTTGCLEHYCQVRDVESRIIVLHFPQEKTPNSVEQIWDLATQSGML